MRTSSPWQRISSTHQLAPPRPPPCHPQAPTFPESNLMHAINGYIYCNGPKLQLQSGQKMRLIIMGFGSEVDMHSPVFVGQSITHQGELGMERATGGARHSAGDSSEAAATAADCSRRGSGLQYSDASLATCTQTLQARASTPLV